MKENFIDKTEYPLVSVCVPTYRRPEGIRQCLISLLQQQADFPFEIVVTENEAGFPSHAVIEPLIQQAMAQNIPIKYVCEPRRGYSFVRNRGLEEASADFIAFIDDDEIATSSWLQQLMKACREMDADAVHGSVEYLFPENFPPWMRGIHFYTRHSKNFQQAPFEAPWFCTNNLLLKRSALDRTPVFDEDFSYTGMEDTDLGVYLVTSHRRIVQAPRALVSEWQSLERCRLAFFFRRSRKEGYALAKIGFKYFGVQHGGIFIVKKYGSGIFYLLKQMPSLFCRPRTAITNMLLAIGTMIGYSSFLLLGKWLVKRKLPK